MGYPPGTEEKTTGVIMFRRATPSEEGVYTFDKIIYDGKQTWLTKTGEVVHFRKAKESDVEAIKKAFDLEY